MPSKDQIAAFYYNRGLLSAINTCFGSVDNMPQDPGIEWFIEQNMLKGLMKLYNCDSKLAVAAVRAIAKRMQEDAQAGEPEQAIPKPRESEPLVIKTPEPVRKESKSSNRVVGKSPTPIIAKPTQKPTTPHNNGSEPTGLVKRKEPVEHLTEDDVSKSHLLSPDDLPYLSSVIFDTRKFSADDVLEAIRRMRRLPRRLATEVFQHQRNLFEVAKGVALDVRTKPHLVVYGFERVRIAVLEIMARGVENPGKDLIGKLIYYSYLNPKVLAKEYLLIRGELDKFEWYVVESFFGFNSREGIFSTKELAEKMNRQEEEVIDALVKALTLMRESKLK